MHYNNNNSDNKRILKNAIALYTRMLVVMVVSIFTSRIVLSELGVVDYGIYNVVGSAVTMFAFLKTAMSGATHRFITYNLGLDNKSKLQIIFSSSLLLHILIAMVVVLLVESLGLWFLYNKLVIPVDRFDAAFWTLQLSMVACCVSILSVPFDAEIIAHERMDVYAYLSLFDVISKLVVALSLTYCNWDKLVFYAGLLVFVQVIQLLFYYVFCRHNFEETRLTILKDLQQIKEMMSFAGWNLFGHLASAVYAQGLNILLNTFFGPAVNAARGVALTIESSINAFLMNFQLAFNPQITKSYAKSDMDRFHQLVFSCSKFSFFLFFLIGFPVFLEIDIIMTTWLKEVPEHACNFLRLIMIGASTTAFFMPINTACNATGKVRRFNTIRGLTNVSIIPIAYIVLRVTKEAESMYVVQAVVLILSVFIQLWISRRYTNIKILSYVKCVMVPSVAAAAFSIPIPFYLYKVMPAGYVPFFLICSSCIILTSCMVYIVGLTPNERKMIEGMVKTKILRK